MCVTYLITTCVQKFLSQKERQLLLPGTYSIQLFDYARAIEGI